jgi:hypothetical protein
VKSLSGLVASCRDMSSVIDPMITRHDARRAGYPHEALCISNRCEQGIEMCLPHRDRGAHLRHPLMPLIHKNNSAETA